MYFKEEEVISVGKIEEFKGILKAQYKDGILSFNLLKKEASYKNPN